MVNSEGRRLQMIWNLCLADTVTNILMLPAHLLSSAPVYHGPTISFQHQVAKEEGGRGRVVNITIPDNSQVHITIPDNSQVNSTKLQKSRVVNITISDNSQINSTRWQERRVVNKSQVNSIKCQESRVVWEGWWQLKGKQHQKSREQGGLRRVVTAHK